MQIHRNQLKATTCYYLVQCVTKILLIELMNSMILNNNRWMTHFFVSLSLYLQVNIWHHLEIYCTGLGSYNMTIRHYQNKDD